VINNASLVLAPLAAAALWTLRGYAMFWLLAILSGTAVVASLQAALTIFNLVNLLYASLVNIIGSVASRAYESGETQRAWRAARPYILVVLPPLFLFLGVALSFPEFVLLLFYGHDSPYLQLGYLFPYLAITSAAMVPGELITAFFLGIRETRILLKINLIGVTAVAFSVPPFFATFGVLEGACLALAAGEVLRLTLLILCLRQLIGDRSARNTQVPSEFSLLQKARAKA
jgi:O-antigen/teichoic acid export membrane protein